MSKFKIYKIFFQALTLLIILNLNCVSFAEDLCSDNVNGPGLPTFTDNSQHPENWFTNPVIKTSQETVSRNNFIEVWIALSGWGSPPYQWEVTGSGFHFNDISGPSSEEINDHSKRLQLWADGTACGSAEIKVTDSKGKNDVAFVRNTAGTWYWTLAWRSKRDGASCGKMGDCGNQVTQSIIIGKNKWLYSTIDWYHRNSDVNQKKNCKWQDWSYPKYKPIDGPYKTPLEGTSWSSCSQNRPYASWARVNIYEWRCE